MNIKDENNEEISGQDIIDEEVIASIEKRTKQREEEQRSMRIFGRTGREMAEALYYGTSVPILVAVGIVIGWILTEDKSSTIRALGVSAGATLGLLWAIYDIIRRERKKEELKK